CCHNFFVDFTINNMLSFPVIITFSPLAMVSSEAAWQVVPLKSTLPFSPGEISDKALAVLPKNSSSRRSVECFLFHNIFENHFLSKRILATELIKKIINCWLMERSKKRHRIATIHAPTAKKKRISPGSTNSKRKKTNPMIIQITAAVRKLSIEI